LAKSRWNVTMEERNGEFIVEFEGSAKKTDDLLAAEALLRSASSWGHDINFKDGVAPKTVKKKWILPLTKVKARINPGKGKKKKGKGEVSDDAMQLYRQFNGEEPKNIEIVEAWLPDMNSPLVALGEAFCPFIGYESAKANKKGEIDTYIHHFGEEGGEKPKLYVTMPPKGYKRMLLIIGGDWDIEERGDGKTWLVN